MSETATQPTGPTNVEDVEEAMRDVVDPELGINVVDLGLVYGITVEGSDGERAVVIDMTLTSAACPLTDVIEDQAHSALTGGPTPLASEVRINWVWMPPWARTRSPTTAASSCARWASTSELSASELHVPPAEGMDSPARPATRRRLDSTACSPRARSAPWPSSRRSPGWP